MQTPPDGACLFHALLRGLNINYEDKGKRKFTAEHLRDFLVYAMMMKANEVLDEKTEELRGLYGLPKEQRDARDTLGPYSYRKYLQMMLRGDSWGDSLIVWAFSRFLGLRVTIVDATTLIETRVRHNLVLLAADIVIAFNSRDHYIATERIPIEAEATLASLKVQVTQMSLLNATVKRDDVWSKRNDGSTEELERHDDRDDWPTEPPAGFTDDQGQYLWVPHDCVVVQRSVIRDFMESSKRQFHEQASLLKGEATRSRSETEAVIDEADAEAAMLVDEDEPTIPAETAEEPLPHAIREEKNNRIAFPTDKKMRPLPGTGFSNRKKITFNKDGKCSECSKKVSLAKRKDHAAWEREEKGYQCFKKTCRRLFTTSKSRNLHMKTHERSVKDFQCGICKDTFQTKQTLQRHRKAHDEVASGKKYNCQFCDMEHPTSKQHREHEFKCPENEHKKVYKCPTCDAEFDTGSNRNRHARKYCTNRKK